MTRTATPPRVIRLAHTSPGRLRLRLPWLAHDRAGASALAEHLARRPGVTEVEVRPRTGSVLCLYDPRRCKAGALINAVRRQTRVAIVLPAGAPMPAVAQPPRPPGSALGRALANAFRGLDDEIFASTGGRADLGALASVGLFAAGALEVAATRQLPAPPWFSLAWWAVRTFMMFEQPAPDAEAD